MGAVLEKERNGEWLPVSFFSRKLGQSQLNWTPREKETYAIVASLRKWAGWVGFQPVLVKTDHRSLENWVLENILHSAKEFSRHLRYGSSVKS